MQLLQAIYIYINMIIGAHPFVKLISEKLLLWLSEANS